MADPIEEQLRAAMNDMAHGLDEVLNGPKMPGVAPKFGFVLLVAKFGEIDDGRVNYVSNGERTDMLAMCREYLARAEGRYHETETVQ